MCLRAPHIYAIEQNPAIPLKGQIRTEAVGRSADVILLFIRAVHCFAVLCVPFLCLERGKIDGSMVYARMQCICVCYINLPGL